MDHQQSPQPPWRFAAVTTNDSVIVPDSPESPTAPWPVTHAISGFQIVSMSADTGGRLPRLLEAIWPLLSEAALEIRWVASQGTTTCYILMRFTLGDEPSAIARLEQVMASVSAMAAVLLPGWVLEPLDEAAVSGALRPFPVSDVGDFLRREHAVTLADGQECDVPALLGIDPSELDLLVELMAKAEQPIALSLAAAPTEIDEAERSVLLGELAALERAILERSVPQSVREHPSSHDDAVPVSSVANAAATLKRRVIAPERLGFLRVSFASAGAIPESLIAAAQEALAATAFALEWVPAYEQADRMVCIHNLEVLGFTPWGIQAAEQLGHESINDCYLASVEEIAAELVVPVPDGFMPLAHELLDPSPRPVPSVMPHVGRILGTSLVDGRTVALSHSDRMRHTYVVGQTGTGKSTLLLRLALQDIVEGKGVCVIDPHGDLIDGILDRFPKERAEDLILFDPFDVDRPIPMNLLDANTPEEQDYVIQQMIGMLYRIYDPGHIGIVGPRFENMYRNAALVAMAHPSGGTLLDLARLFTDDRFLAGRLAYVKDPTVRSFWIDERGQTSDYHKSEVLGWFTAKFGAFSSNRFMRAVIGQRTSALSMSDVMDEGKVLLVKLPRGVLGETNALWLGLIFIVKLQMAALARGDRPPAERREFNLYVDEFQNFAMTDFDLLIAEARKYGLALTLAHQHVGQLTDRLRSAIFGNVASWVLFRLGMPDARLVAEELEGFSAHDVAKLANYRCIVRTTVDGEVMVPFDLRTLPPSERLGDSELREAITRLSALKYGRSIEVVEAEYLDSWGSTSAKSKRTAEQERAPIPAATIEDPDASSKSDAPLANQPPDFAEAREAIVDLLKKSELDAALGAFGKLFVSTGYSPGCWPLFEQMKTYYAHGELQEKYETMRVEIEALLADPQQ